MTGQFEDDLEITEVMIKTGKTMGIELLHKEGNNVCSQFP